MCHLLWVLLLISLTPPFTSSPSSSSLWSPCCSYCLTPSTSMMSWINTLRTSAEDLAPWPRTSLPQVMSPTTASSQRLMSNTPRSPRASNVSLMTSNTMTRPSARRCLTRAKDEPIALKKKACRLVCRRQSVMIERWDLTCVERPRNSETHFWKRTDQDSPGATKRADSLWPSSRDSKTRIPSWVRQKKSSKIVWNDRVAKKKKFVERIKETNDVDKIINLFMNSYWSKIEIFVKLMRKASVKWKNWSDFKAQLSIQFQRKLIEDRDTFLELTCKIQELQNEVNCMNDSKVLKDAESVSIRHSQVASQLVSFPPHPVFGGMPSRSLGMPSRKNGPPSIWDAHGISVNVFANPAASSSAPYPQELNPWSSHISEQVHSSQLGKSENRTPVQDQRCQSGPLAKNSVIPSEGDSTKNYGADQQRLQIFRSSFCWIPTASDICLLEDKIQDWGMYLFTISYGNYAVDQRSGAGWFSGWSQSLRVLSEDLECQILTYSMRRLLQHWTESSLILTSKEGSVWRNKKPKKRTVSFVEDRSLTWSTSFSGSLEPTIPMRIMPTCSLLL